MHTAMILAAGRGTRLSPLTDHLPKALSPLNHIPIIEYHIHRLVKAGYQKAIINHAHLGGKIRQHLRTGRQFGLDIIYCPEPPGGLETGGGIFNALPALGDAPFLVLNADVYCELDLSTVTLAQDSLSHLLLVPKPDYRQTGDFGLEGSGLLSNEHQEYVFAGIACYHPVLFAACKPGRYSIAPLLRKWVAKKRVTGTLYQKTWFDIGTHAQLTEAENSLKLQQRG